MEDPVMILARSTKYNADYKGNQEERGTLQ
jgi:hypothetical protein